MSSIISNALILSIETSGEQCAAALHLDGKLVSSKASNIEKSHSEKLLCIIINLLNHSPYNLEQLSAVCISEGPGSYTGLRIGASTAKGLCYALSIPLITINTLKLMAEEITLNKKGYIICPMIDARRMEVYTLLKKPDGNYILPPSAQIMTHEKIKKWLSYGPIIFVGNGVEKCLPWIEKSCTAQSIPKLVPSITLLGMMAYESYLKKSFEPIEEYEPFYLKPFYSPGNKFQSN